MSKGKYENRANRMMSEIRKSFCKNTCYVTILEIYESKLNVVRSGSQDSVVGYLTRIGSAVSKWKHLHGWI
jgi:hypothetical protein